MVDFKISKAAERFRDTNGFGSTEPIRLKSFLQKLNVITVFKPLNGSFSGMALKTGDHRFMMVNSEHALGKQHFTICHELYHLFIQENFSSMTCKTGRFNIKEPDEYKADLFAGYLLMPDAGIKSVIPDNELKRNKVSLGTIIRLEQYFSCSRRALLVRLTQMGLIDYKNYEHHTLGVKHSASLYGYGPDLYSPGNHNEFIGNYGELAKTMYDKEVISYSNYLGLMQDINIEIEEEKLDTHAQPE